MLDDFCAESQPSSLPEDKKGFCVFMSQASLPFFKSYPKDIVFELRACDPQDAPLVLYLATVTWPDGGIDPQDERQLSRLRKMLGWRKDTFVRAIKSYIEVCGEGAGKLLPSFLKRQQSPLKSQASAPELQASAPELQASAPELQASDVELQASDVELHASAPELQKNAPKSNESSRANTSELELESEVRDRRQPQKATAPPSSAFTSQHYTGTLDTQAPPAWVAEEFQFVYGKLLHPHGVELVVQRGVKDRELWRKTLGQWRGNGYSERNVSGMVDAYEKLQAQAGGNNAPRPNLNPNRGGQGKAVF